MQVFVRPYTPRCGADGFAHVTACVEVRVDRCGHEPAVRSEALKREEMGIDVQKRAGRHTGRTLEAIAAPFGCQWRLLLGDDRQLRLSRN